MAVTVTHLRTEVFTADATSWPTTAAIAPSANKPIGVYVAWAQTTPGTPSLSGNGLTWVQHGSTVVQGSRAGAMFRSLGASPSSGALTLTITGGTGTPSRGAISIVEFTNADTSGTNGSGAFLQANKNNKTASGNSLAVTMDAFSSTSNAVFGGIMEDSGGSITVGSGFSEVGQANNAGEGFSIQTQFKDSNDTSVDWTTADTTVLIAIAAEIKAADSNSGGFLNLF